MSKSCRKPEEAYFDFDRKVDFTTKGLLGFILLAHSFTREYPLKLSEHLTWADE
jgi:hypothetical protein